MKALNFIDLAGQSLIIGWMLLAQIFGGMTFQFDIVAAACIYAALFLGPWQMVSSFITTMSWARFHRWRVLHLVTATIYLIFIPSMEEIMKPGGTVVDNVGALILFGVPAALAIFYYAITVKTFMSLGTATRLKYFFAHDFHKILKVLKLR